VFRILGKPAGIFVLLMDALKGWVAVRIVAFRLVDTLLPPDSLDGSREVGAIIAALFAVLGHNYTCWLHFKGGKGIATSAGVLTALVPWALLIILGVWIVLFALTRYVSLGSIFAAAVLPFATWFTTKSILLTVVTSAMAALAIYKHKGNIQRLLAGTESRIHFKKEKTAS
jgi:glycerol-3-phosphate acyltransferase PlsY